MINLVSSSLGSRLRFSPDATTFPNSNVVQGFAPSYCKITNNTPYKCLGNTSTFVAAFD